MNSVLEKKDRPVRAVITGGMGGVGQAVARQLAQEGVSVSIWYHTTPIAEVETCIASLPGFGHSARAVDLADISGLEKAIEAECADGADVVVHAAVGKLIRKTILQTSVEQLRNCLEQDVLGTFVLLTKFGGFLKAQNKGEIYVITTAALERTEPVPAMSAYLTSKAAVREMVRHLASELQGTDVLVHTIAPGFMATGLQADLPARWVEMLSEKEPGGKLMEPADVALYISSLRSRKKDSPLGLNHVLGKGAVTPI